MRKSFKSSLAAALCGVMALTAMPAEVLAGSMSATSSADIGLTAAIETVHYRRHRHWHYVRYYHPRRYYRYGYRYDPAGAIFAGAALGLIGAGMPPPLRLATTAGATPMAAGGDSESVRHFTNPKQSGSFVATSSLL